MTRKQVLVFRELPPSQLARLRAAHHVTVANPRVPGEQAAFFAALPHAHGLIGSSFRIGAEVLAQAPLLEVISSVSVGTDNYDLDALQARGIVLHNTPGVLTEATADMLMGLVLATSRRLVELALLVREGRWTRHIDESLYGWDLRGKRLGIVGFGRIGQALARRAALGFGMDVLYHSRRPVDLSESVDSADLAGRVAHRTLDELLAQSDTVALTLPLTAESQGLMNAERFQAMKPGAIFINGSRGGIVEEPALLAALDSGHLRAAGLDVFATEPLPLDSPLRLHPRVTALPHIGSATHETRAAMAELATSNLLHALAIRLPGQAGL